MIRVLLVDDQPIVRAGLRTLLGVESDIGIVGKPAMAATRFASRSTFDPMWS